MISAIEAHDVGCLKFKFKFFIIIFESLFENQGETNARNRYEG